jgi:hypothetical protein
LNRLQLFFNEKPNEIEQRQLMFFGFKWAPSQGAWQRQLNGNAIDAADRLPFLKPLDGRSVRGRQPKAPVHETIGRYYEGQMGIKINREIRDYTESIFFGLSLRQVVFAVDAVLAAVGIFFALRPHFGIETLSWVCALGAAPFAALGFIRYNGMAAERFAWAWLYSAWFQPKTLAFRATNYYYEALRPLINAEWGSCTACRVGKGGKGK